MKKLSFVCAVLAASLLICSCGKNFRDAAKSHGVNSGIAVTPGDLLDEQASKIIKENCYIVTYENSMKWANLRPNKTFWNWSDIDALVKFAEENKMQVKWHTLFWHQQRY